MSVFSSRERWTRKSTWPFHQPSLVPFEPSKGSHSILRANLRSGCLSGGSRLRRWGSRLLPGKGILISPLSRGSPGEKLTKGRRSGLWIHLFIQSFLNIHCVSTVCQTRSGNLVPAMKERSGSALGERALWWSICQQAVLQNQLSGGVCAGENGEETSAQDSSAAWNRAPLPFREGFSLRPAVTL